MAETSHTFAQLVQNGKFRVIFTREITPPKYNQQCAFVLWRQKKFDKKNYVKKQVRSYHPKFSKKKNGWKAPSGSALYLDTLRSYTISDFYLLCIVAAGSVTILDPKFATSKKRCFCFLIVSFLINFADFAKCCSSFFPSFAYLRPSKFWKFQRSAFDSFTWTAQSGCRSSNLWGSSYSEST